MWGAKRVNMVVLAAWQTEQDSSAAGSGKLDVMMDSELPVQK